MSDKTKDQETAEAGEFADRKPARQSGGVKGYSVEGRYDGYEPARQINGQLFGPKWTQISFAKVAPPYGVPIGAPYETTVLEHCGLFSYASAQALRWWFQALAETAGMREGFALQTRLVQHSIKYEFTWQPVSAHCEIGPEDRSSIMPDWGSK